jgi:hypothetical protein
MMNAQRDVPHHHYCSYSYPPESTHMVAYLP